MLKTPRSPFDKLRANGLGYEFEDFPLVLSPSTSSGQALSKHASHFYNNLLHYHLSGAQDLPRQRPRMAPVFV
jgi:hypothetical protein